MRTGRDWRISAVLLALLGLATWGAPARDARADGARPDPSPKYYLALGDSLSVGVQPDDAGVGRPTREGYPNQLHAALLQRMPRLRLKQLGCPGETSESMLRGDSCRPGRRSQLAEAVTFLREHRGEVALVTIDIGANDVEPCGGSGGIDETCVREGFASVATHLPPILAALRLAAGPRVPIIGMNYYNPFLAAWFSSPELAEASTEVLAAFNGLLGATYRVFRVPVADVATAFRSDDVTPVDGIPVNVLMICQLTWMCAGPPEGPNIHPNVIGYGVIASAFLDALP